MARVIVADANGDPIEIEIPDEVPSEPVPYEPAPTETTPVFNYEGGGDKGGSAPTLEEVKAVSNETTGIGFNPDNIWQGSTNTQGYNPNASPSSGVARTVDDSKPTTVSSFFSELSKSFTDDMKKNPTAYLKMGLDGYASANTSKNAKEAAALNRQSAIDQQNNAQALKNAENDKYNASFNFSKKPTATKQKPLTRIDGRRVFDPNGNIVR